MAEQPKKTQKYSAIVTFEIAGDIGDAVKLLETNDKLQVSQIAKLG